MHLPWELILFPIFILTIYIYRDYLGRIGDNITNIIFPDILTRLINIQESEHLAEKIREKEFIERLPKLSKVPIVGWALRIVHAEGWQYYIPVILIVTLYSFVIISRLGLHGFFVDEFFHALIVKNWIESRELFRIGADTVYFRGGLVAILAIISKSLLPAFSDEFAYRFPIALFGICNVILIYLFSKKISGKSIALLVTIVFATDVWFLQFASYLRFYTPSITVILLIFIFLIKTNFSTRSMFYAFSSSIFLYIALSEYFLFIAVFIGFIILVRMRYENPHLYHRYLIIFFAICLIGIAWKAIQMGDIIETYDIFKYDIYDFTATLAHLKWLIINYWYFLFGVLLSIPIILKSLPDIFKGQFNPLNFVCLYILYNLFLIFGYINHISFNFTFRPFLYILPIGILIGVLLIVCNFFYTEKKKSGLHFLLLFGLLSIVVGINLHGVALYVSHTEGEYFPPYKLVYENQPIIIDTKSPNIFVENHLISSGVANYSIFVVDLNEYPFVYYTDIQPDYLVRGPGSMGRVSTIGTPLIYDPEEFMSQIVEEVECNNEVYIIRSANTFPIKNRLQKLIFNRDYILETPPSIAHIITSNFQDQIIYVGNDGYSTVYRISNLRELKRDVQ